MNNEITIVGAKGQPVLAMITTTEVSTVRGEPRTFSHSCQQV